jgi:23S rRNA pseudouridine1911/1915/1917 synthase
LKPSKIIISTESTQEDHDELLDALQVSEIRDWQIDTALDGSRLDRALAQLIPEFSRSYLQQLIGKGCVRSQGQALTKPSQVVKWGQHGTIELLPTPMSQAFVPQAMLLDLVFEDAHLLVLNKQAGLVVHPAPGHWSGTLLNGLMWRDPKACELPRAGIVHRLDKDTSGLMVVAKTRAAMDALSAMISVHEVQRQYLCIGHRGWSGRLEREVEAPIGRDPRNRLRMAVVDMARLPGKTARTSLTCLSSGPQVCWVQCNLHTGRTHQIRVHMASIGHPLVGDSLYGGHALGGLDRQALHAFRLAFKHPISHTPLEFECALPQDISSALQALELPAWPRLQ